MKNPTSRMLEGKRIFIVEDDVVNLYIATKILAKSGAIIYTNYNSISIVAHIVQFLPLDLICMDIMLRKGISGYDMFHELKENRLTAQIPVVAITSLDPEVEIAKAKAAGFDGYISKPIEALTFSETIASIIMGHKRWVISR